MAITYQQTHFGSEYSKRLWVQSSGNGDLSKPGFHLDISISIRTDAGAENQSSRYQLTSMLRKMADDTVDCLALMFMLMSPPFSLVKSAT